MTNQDTLVAVLREHACVQGERPALTFVADLVQQPSGETLSYQDLDVLARRTAVRLRDRCAVGDRALLLFPAGLPFAVALLGCLYAGVVAVPVPLPDRSEPSRRRCTAVVRHAGVGVVLTEEVALPAVTGWRDADGLGHLDCVVIDLEDRASPQDWVPPEIGPDTVALLQYTSGSTSEPKGVIVTHDTILAQVAMSRRMMDVGPESRFGGWLPMHHDLGLLGQLLQPVALGALSVLMPPFEFLKRPMRWLELIDKHRLDVSLAPNFAYQMCLTKVTDAQVATLDLSGWRVAGNGAEAVQASTLEGFSRRFAPAGFRAETFTVGYGLAEAMAYTSVGPRDEPPRVCQVDAARLERDEFVPAAGPAELVSRVSCGRPCEVEIRIVDPGTGTPLPDGRVGEIWLRGRSVAPGYWDADEASRAAFGATTTSGETGYLRTGDLGALHLGELFVTGRLRDMVVVRGRNLYPQDIEHEVGTWHEALGAGVGAVFAVASPGFGEELVLVHECQATWPDEDGPAALAAVVRDRLARQYGIQAGGIVLVRPGGVARTTSGKVRRSAMRQLFVEDGLRSLHEDLSPRVRRAFRPEYPATAAADTLNRALGDPSDEDSELSYARLSELDATEVFPAAACAALDALGLPRYYVPAIQGGALTSYEEVLHLMRAVARRDLTLAIAHGKTFLGAAGVWVAGRPDQTAGLAADILAGTRVCWGLTEREHGSDLLAGEVTAQLSPDGYRVSGEKWLINNATQGDLVCLLARTDPAGGPRGFSLLLVDKRTLPAGSYGCLPKVPTHGIRAADISGIGFHDALVPATALVGPPGGGLEILGKAFQLTRTGAPALSLGAADQAFELVLGYVGQRRLYGRTLLELPKVRAELGEACATVFVAEALSLLASRGIHVLTDEMSVLSAVTKYLVPTLVDDLLSRLGELLGARAFLSDVHAGGRFAKLERDHRIVGIFDGSTAVNLSLIITQFPTLVRGYRRRLGSAGAVALAADLARPVPPVDLSRLSLMARSGCGTTQALRVAVEELAKLAAAGEVPAPVLRDAEAFLAATDDIYDELAATAPSGRGVSATSFATAHQFALCVAGAACVHVWLANRSWPAVAGAPWADGQWLRAALGLLLSRLLPGRYPPPYQQFVELFDAVNARPGAISLLPSGRTGPGEGGG